MENRQQKDDEHRKKRMRILVTGAAGFTGSCLVDRLLERGHEVIALAHKSKGYSDEIRSHGAKVIFGSIDDRKLMEKLTKDVDVVFNIAATFRDVSLPAGEYDRSNALGVKVLVDAAKKNNVRRFVHCSTCGVHGEVKQIPANEDAPLKPLDHYQETKLQGELIVQDYIKEGFPAVVIRPAGIYGPRDRRFLKIFKAIKKRRFVMLGSGEVYYHMCYIDNLLDAFELAMTRKEAVGRTYLIADEHYITLNELVEAIAEGLNVRKPKIRLPVWPVWLAGLVCEAVCRPLGISPPIFRRRVNFFIKNRAFDISRAKKELGYVPKVSLKEGIRKTIKWYEEKGWL